MKIGTGAKVTIGVIGVLIVGFTGFEIVTHQPDQEVLSPRQATQETPAESPKTLKAIQQTADGQEIEHTEKGQEKPSDKEVESFIDYLDNLDGKPEYEESRKATAEIRIENSEVENDDRLVIDPELEEMFVAYKAFVDKLAPITKELAPLDYRGSLISARLGELADEMVAVHRDGRKQQQLQAEIQRLIKEQDEIEAARRPYLALNEQLVDEFDQHLQTYHDMTYQEFQDLRTGPERETWITWLNSKQ